MWRICVLLVFVGVISGIVLRGCMDANSYVGTLRVDHSDMDEPPYLFLEMTQDSMSRIANQKTVTLRVRFENYLQQTRK